MLILCLSGEQEGRAPVNLTSEQRQILLCVDGCDSKVIGRRLILCEAINFCCKVFRNIAA